MNNNEHGFSLLELLMSLAIIFTFATLAHTSLDKLKDSFTKREMKTLVAAIQFYEAEEGRLPSTLKKLSSVLEGDFEQDQRGEKYTYSKVEREICSPSIIINNLGNLYCEEF